MAEVKSCTRCVSSNNFVIVYGTYDLECAYCGYLVANIEEKFKKSEKKERERKRGAAT